MEEDYPFKFKMAVIDLDPLVYKCGFAVQKTDKETGIVHVEPAKNAFYNMNSMMRKILSRTGAKEYRAFLTASKDKTNYRYEVYPKYKESRGSVPRPVHYDVIREYLIKQWNAEVVFGEEADDACSYSHMSYLESKPDDFNVFKSVVCSIDKDFNNIPGYHYNYGTDLFYEVSPIEALRNFYLQILTGDSADDIPRIKKGWRQKKAEELINFAVDEEELVDIVRKEMHNVLKDKSEVEINNEFTMRGKLLWLRRTPNEIWTLPQFSNGFEKI